MNNDTHDTGGRLPKKIVSLTYSEEYRLKERCLEMAEQILSDGRLDGMTKMEIAQEIYFHARAFSFCKKHEDKGWKLIRWVIERADPIDLADHGDTKGRKAIYSLFWLLHII